MTDNKKPHTAGAGTASKTAFNDTYSTKSDPLPGWHSLAANAKQSNPKGAGALCIAEGFATGVTIHEATSYPVAIAFNAGNLGAVAKAMRDKFPDLRLILCADDDHRTEGNPGLTKVIEEARPVGGLLAIPVFGSSRPEGATDFNDMTALLGLEAVQNAIANATNQGDADNLRAYHSARPEPLPALPDVLPLDYDYLPGGLRGFVRDISERMQCTADFAAVAVFVMMGTIIGRKVGIRPMRHNDWIVIYNLWGGLAAISTDEGDYDSIKPGCRHQIAEHPVVRTDPSTTSALESRQLGRISWTLAVCLFFADVLALAIARML